MNRQFARLTSSLIVLVLFSAPAFAHHLMGGRTPASFTEGILSGLGHPVIGLDHFAAVVAVGYLAAAHRAAPALAIAFVLAMMAGVALHLAWRDRAGRGNTGGAVGYRSRRHHAVGS